LSFVTGTQPLSWELRDGLPLELADLRRTIIIGNSGSGKSTLAAWLAEQARCDHVDLDQVYWADQRLLRKRVAPAARAMVAKIASGESWVIEGVFGWLVDEAVARATTLVWLDPPWSDCKAGLEARGPAASPSEAEYQALLLWAGQYWGRSTSSSHAGHRKIYEAFAGDKVVLRGRQDASSDVMSVGTPSG
jgi:hypothetical protein